MRSLVVLPEDSGRPLVEAIEAASRSLRVKMFAFSDPVLVHALVGARRRGVNVRVLLDGGHHYGEENRRAAARLERGGVEVAEGGPAFSVTHEKSLVVDDAVAFVGTLNFTTKNLTSTRDYVVVTSQAREVREIAAVFDADWHGQSFHPRAGGSLVWSPGSRDRFASFIDEARRSLVVQSERLLDVTIIERMVRAVGRGVKVRVMTRSPRTLEPKKRLDGIGMLRILAEVGAKNRELDDPRLHAKLLLRDSAAALVGSTNLTPGSFDRRRELAIEVRDAELVDRLTAVTRRDWKRSAQLDLSTEALAAARKATAALHERAPTHEAGAAPLRSAA